MATAVAQFCEEVGRRRRSLGLTIDELAERTEVTSQYFSAVERGLRRRGPSLGVALRIAQAFGVELGELLGSVKGLSMSAGGMEAGKLYDSLPAEVKDAILQMLRMLARFRAEEETDR